MVAAVIHARRLKSISLLRSLKHTATNPKSRQMARPTAANMASGKASGGTAKLLKKSRIAIWWSAEEAKRDATGLGWNTITSIPLVATCRKNHM